MRKLLALAVIGLCGCPSPSGTDGGSTGGGATAGGFVAAGGSATAGGSAAAGGSPMAGGSVTGGGAAGGAPLITPSVFCSTYATAQCDAEQRCGTLAGAQRASCLLSRGLQCAAQLTKLDAGAWRFDDVSAKTVSTGSRCKPTRASARRWRTAIPGGRPAAWGLPAATRSAPTARTASRTRWAAARVSRSSASARRATCSTAVVSVRSAPSPSPPMTRAFAGAFRELPKARRVRRPSSASMAGSA